MKQKERLENNHNLMPRKKPWIGEINFPETNNISNSLTTITNDELLVWQGQPLSQKFLRTINEDQRDEIAKDIFNFLKKYDFNSIRFSEKDINQAWNSLKKYVPKTEKINGITYLSNSGTSGSQVYRHFFPNIIKVRNSSGRRSIYDVLTNPDTLWATIRNRIGNTLLYNDDPNGIPVQYPMNLNLGQSIIGAKNSGLASMGSIFKPTVAKTIYKHYVKDGYNVLDYSCGFGTRLLGLMSCGFKNVKYCGYEPNTETYDNLQTMIKKFEFNAEIKKCGSEEKLFDDKFDFVFSSPPYFDWEIYSSEASQCYNKFPEYNQWLENYWRKTVQNIKLMMKDNGVLGVNIGGKANELMQRLEADLNSVIIEEGFELVDTWFMKTSQSHLVSTKKGNEDKKTKLEGIFFYRKTVAKE
jgi:hypothetical protein